MQDELKRIQKKYRRDVRKRRKLKKFQTNRTRLIAIKKIQERKENKNLQYNLVEEL
jgi:hypothetical protein